MRTRIDLWAVLAFHGVAIVALSSCDIRIPEKLDPRNKQHEAVTELVDSPPARGVLRVSTFAAPGVQAASSLHTSSTRSSAPALHRSSFVNGTGYPGMEDNDLRGFLDGTFKYAWNQPGQVHVRIGRRDTGPRFGEHEIFRVIHRWSPLGLPPDATVRRARLVLSVERGPADTLRLVLYEIKKDWNPGIGGTLRDNVSPPNHGEVWWNEIAADSATWAFPGVGFASDDDSNADTGAMPLADAVVAPGAPAFTFESAALADYATRRAREGAPLLFLLKVSDVLEDTPGTVLQVYSGNTGDSRNLARRPRFEIEWDASSETSTFERTIHLEHGRALEFRSIPCAGEMVAASFFPDSGTVAPTIEMRAEGGAGAGAAVAGAAGAAEGGAGDTGTWRRLEGVASPEGNWAQVRVGAWSDPVVLGTPFQATMRDTWIRNGRPEDQKAPWTFVAPSGVRHERLAEYAGESTWRVELVPDEIGTWRYSWSQSWAEHPFSSGEATFDVVLGEASDAIAPLQEITKSATLVKKGDNGTMAPLLWRFARLERAVILAETPEQFASAEGESLKAALRAARKALGRETVPDSIPRVPDLPPEWKKTGS